MVNISMKKFKSFHQIRTSVLQSGCPGCYHHYFLVNQAYVTVLLAWPAFINSSAPQSYWAAISPPPQKKATTTVSLAFCINPSAMLCPCRCNAIFNINGCRSRCKTRVFCVCNHKTTSTQKINIFLLVVSNNFTSK